VPIKDVAKYNAYMARYMGRRYQERRAACIHKLGGKCVRCGGKTKLEFDHIDPKSKAFDVGKLLASVALAKLETELTKCQLLCREHHHEKTLRENGMQAARCGTLSGYRYCRCAKCKNAKRVWNKQYRETHHRTNYKM
jgi:5-methylcytosine-specific restriction endonuclease McrA